MDAGYIELTKKRLNNPAEQLFIVNAKVDKIDNTPLFPFTSYLLLLKNEEKNPQESRGFMLFKTDTDSITIKRKIDPITDDAYKRDYIADILSSPYSKMLINKDSYYNKSYNDLANNFDIRYEIYTLLLSKDDSLPLPDLIENYKLKDVIISQEMNALTPEKINALTLEDISELDTTQISKLNKDQLILLTRDAVKKFSEKQVQAINQTELGKLTLKQYEDVFMHVERFLSPEQKKVIEHIYDVENQLTPDYVDKLSLLQIENILHNHSIGISILNSKEMELVQKIKKEKEKEISGNTMEDGGGRKRRKTKRKHRKSKKSRKHRKKN